MEDSTRISSKSRAGTPMSPGDAQERLGAPRGGQYANSALPDRERDELAEARQDDRVGARPPGTVRAPVGVAKSAPGMLSGDRMQVLMDKLAERAAFERGGVRLYDALMAKHWDEIEDGVHGLRGTAEMSHDTLFEFRQQEAEHFLLVSDAIVQLGGDPTAQTPGAEVVGTMSMGLVQMVTDPRTTLTQGLGAVLAAELTDVASWDLLGKLADATGQEQLARDCREAMHHEEQHLQTIRTWHTALVMGESGPGRSATDER
jgi:hypothetical protein